MRRQAHYSWLDHTADLMIRVKGGSEADLYESAALALTEIIAQDLDGDEETLAIEVNGETAADRLVALLRELIYRFDTEALLVVAAKAVVDGARLALQAHAIRFDPQRHHGLREVKAVTYHELRVWREANTWLADVVFVV
jgi:SHS2 domain-containing protein